MTNDLVSLDELIRALDAEAERSARAHRELRFASAALSSCAPDGNHPTVAAKRLLNALGWCVLARKDAEILHFLAERGSVLPSYAGYLDDIPPEVESALGAFERELNEARLAERARLTGVIR